MMLLNLFLIIPKYTILIFRPLYTKKHRLISIKEKGVMRHSLILKYHIYGIV